MGFAAAKREVGVTRMNFTPASPGSVMVFTGILLAVVCAFLVAARRAYAAERGGFLVVVFGAGAWIGLMAAAVASGRMWELPLHGLPFFFGGVLVVSVGAGLSPLGRRMADVVPLAALVAFQGFRLPLELVLHTWAGQGTIPATMTWTGQNWDVVTGAVALLAAPLPFGWGQQPALLLAFHLPYALIGPVCVGGALFGHVVLTRALLRGK